MLPRIFIGFDPSETISLHVLVSSIMRHAKQPVSITPLVLRQTPVAKRRREPDQTTEFSFTRYLVPWLCDFQGQALFMDCDMLVRCDIAEVFACADPYADVSVVKHDYVPKDDTKFLGKVQTKYERKNWSSLMVFNNERCSKLIPELITEAPASYLRQMRWADTIGELPRTFNHLVGEYPPDDDAKIVHFTIGSPCFARYARCEHSEEWHAERSRVLSYNRFNEFSLPHKVDA